MNKKIIITVAVTGSFPTKEMNPAVPYSPKEIAEAAVESYKAGAAIVHVHVRDPKTGKPDFRIELFQEVLNRIRDACDMVINLTTSGFWLTGPDIMQKRLGPVYLKPDICSLDLGSMNFKDRVFNNPPQWSETAAKCMQENSVKPEIEVFEPGHIRQAVNLINKGLIDAPPYFQLCMGVQWGIEATAENFLFMKSQLPDEALWSVLGIGKDQLTMVTLGILLGGHVRVGFEDNLYLSKGVLAKSNAQMVERVADLAERLGRNIATANEARRILGIRNPE
ncbi:MAG: 3-keto-5-aminohexanoate cleavage protein [Deltaproteobacteria bacterium]|nr:3-keto-5-aminohexanoate cleavage protein [Deltaproteobacteria bacterium]MBW1931138.1 3-keto-5-aminohexanoate cleavage protein [Deltaproteobacteria bacterium]MBW2025525.1 3-keto-5-aminohexanoate cleavage protein [Deltaproteobacteria bacterium]MBW2125429.1 3-keto-5-aminohexanoate cleavage protein [Deltaproteobacteria bacterium]